jgi:hypothetical protein
MAYINTDRTGKFLPAASYVGAKLTICPINALFASDPLSAADPPVRSHDRHYLPGLLRLRSGIIELSFSRIAR